VANDEPMAGQAFSVEVVRQLAEVMSRHDLSEVDMDTDAGRLRLRRGPRVAASAMSLPIAMPSTSAGAPVEAAKPSRAGLEIKSEAIGTFYARANPESEPFVKIGSKVTPATVVGLIEAMKMFNEITAGVSGTVTEILVENQQAVEYGSVLYRVEP